ncbi:MAG TPA: NAD(P)/FAD-dependent oxidoreductase [Sphingobium sp.]
MDAQRSEVLIAGGGPTGMVLAYALALRGVSVRLIEETTDCAEDMRASTIHPPTQAMLAELGLMDELLPMGIKAPLYQYYNTSTDVGFELDLTEIADVTPFPWRLQCEQFKLVRVIRAKLDAMPNVEAIFGARVLAFDQGADGVTVHCETPMEVKSYSAQYLVGADGASSTVRKWLRSEFDGFTYPEYFLTLSTEYPIEDYLPWLKGVNYIASPPAWGVILRVPQFWRVLVPVSPDTPEADLLSDARKDAVFAQLLGPHAPPMVTHHRTVYRVHQRVAKTFRHGRVLLAGDAAHLNNPLGGFGMNSGIHDAWNLKDKLIAILRDGGDADALLGRYERQRRTINREFVQTQTIANKKALEGEDGFREREALLDRLTKDADARRAYLLEQGMFGCLEREKQIE